MFYVLGQVGGSGENVKQRKGEKKIFPINQFKAIQLHPGVTDA